MAVRKASYLVLGLFVTFVTWGVWADVEVNMEDRVEVFKGDIAQISCFFKSSEGLGGTMIQWFYVPRANERQRIYYQDSVMNLVEQGTPFTDRISVNGTGATGQVVLTINDVQLKDELDFICLIRGLTDEAAEGRTQLKVFQSPEFPVIEGVQTGISVNEDSPVQVGMCDVKNGFPKPKITWYRNNTPLQSIQGVVDVVPTVTVESTGLFSVNSKLNLKVVKEDKDDDFYCEVTYSTPGGTRMTETERIRIPVYYPPTAVQVWVESPNRKIKEGDSVELRCQDNGNPPATIISFKRLENDETFDTDVLKLNVTRLHSGVYQCTAYDADFEPYYGNTTVSVNFLDDAVIIPKESVVVDQGNDVTATCNALSSLSTQTVWLKDGVEFSKGHTLTVKDASFDKAGTYVCVVTVPEIEGMETNGSLHVNVKASPEILKPKETEIESYETTVDLSCDVRGFPTPDVIWSTSDAQVLGEAMQTVIDGGIQSRVSVQVTSDITATCSASNELGKDSLTFSIKSKGSGVIIAVIIICILLLAILGSVLYFLYKKGKICGRSGKQDLTKEKSSKDNIVVEMKSDNTEEAVLLGVNGEKQLPSDQ